MSEIEITVNGSRSSAPADGSVADLLLSRNLDQRPVAVEVNGTLIPRRDHACTPLRSGDVVEIVTLVGGG